MSSQLPPPPRNVTNTRDMYTWLYRLYAYVTGEIGGQVMDGEAVVAATASALPLVAEQQKELQGLPLLITPDGGGEFAKDLQGNLLLAPPPASAQPATTWQRHFMTMGG